MRLPLPSFVTGLAGEFGRLGARLPGSALVGRHRSSLAVVALAGLGTGMVQFGEPAAVPAALDPATTELAAAPVDTAVDEVDEDDGTTRRYLVVLRQPPPTTTLPPTSAPEHADPHAATTTGHGAAHGTTTTAAAAQGDDGTTAAPRASTIGPSMVITTVPGEDMQQAVVVRLDGTRLMASVPLRYFTLVADPATTARVVPGGVPAGRSLVRDRDGRHWTADLLAVPAVLYELDGQATTSSPSGATTTTVSAHDAGHVDDHSTATTSAGHGGDAHATDGHGDVEDRAAPDTTVRRSRALTSTTSAADALPANVRGTVPEHDREAVLEIAALPGVRSIRAVGGGVYEVVVELDADIDEHALAHVAGVERVVPD